jgi:hypothetical protein
MKIVLLAFLSIMTGATAADTLQDVLAMRLKGASVLPSFDTERTSSFAGYMPISFFEYRYGRGSDNEVSRNSENVLRRRSNDMGWVRGDDDNKKYFRVPWSDDGKEVHTVRVHFKSFTEIAKFEESRRFGEQLVETEKLEITNQRQFNVYMELIEQSLQIKMQKLLEGREDELHKSVENSGQLMGMPKVNVKDLVREMERLQKVDAEYEGVKAKRDVTQGLTEKQASEISQGLIDSVGALAKKMSEAEWRSEKLQIERRRLEIKLSRIDKEISWAKDRKILDHVDFQRDTLERQDAVRIGFNVPFLRFDNEDRARDKAVLAAKEGELHRKENELGSELRRQRLEVLSLAAQVESMKSRLSRAKSIGQKIKTVQDVELRAVLGDFGFELERDVVLVSLKFYMKYLEFMRDQGAFAAYPGQNLLDPRWATL